MIGYIERENSFVRVCVSVDISEMYTEENGHWKINKSSEHDKIFFEGNLWSSPPELNNSKKRRQQILNLIWYYISLLVLITFVNVSYQS